MRRISDCCDVESRNQGGGSVLAGVIRKNRGKQFKVAYRDRIENQRVMLFVISDPVEMAESVNG